jgi:gentisate 1,2-dioxygenase
MSREEYCERLLPQHMAPLWTRLKSIVPKEPTPGGVAHRWAYSDVRPYVLESAAHISAKAAVTRPTGDALARYGSGLLPVGYRNTSLNSPVFNYPYARTRDALHALTRADAPDTHLGHLMRYVNPADGGWAMPTMATMIRLLPRGFATQPCRSSDSMVFVGVEGRGELHVGEQRFAIEPHDVLVVPGWMAYTLHAADDLVLFSCSDRVAQEKLGFWREQRQ